MATCYPHGHAFLGSLASLAVFQTSQVPTPLHLPLPLQADTPMTQSSPHSGLKCYCIKRFSLNTLYNFFLPNTLTLLSLLEYKLLESKIKKFCLPFSPSPSLSFPPSHPLSLPFRTSPPPLLSTLPPQILFHNRQSIISYYMEKGYRRILLIESL